MTVKHTTNRLGLLEGHIKKLKARYRKFGPSSMLHGNCGRQPKHTLDIQLKQKILDISKLPEYDTVNVSHFKDLLEELHAIKISYSALYRLLQNNNIKSPRKHRKPKQHHRRNRRTTMGECIQVDATPHPFFQGDNESYTLHGFMDDANKFLVDYVKKYNKRFGIKAKSNKNSFIPLVKSINLDTLLTVKYTRQVDNGSCFSYKNILFKIQNINILPRVKVELLISKRIGMKIRYKDKLYSVIPILDKNNIAIDNTESVSNIINEFIYFNCLKNERLNYSFGNYILPNTKNIIPKVGFGQRPRKNIPHLRVSFYRDNFVHLGYHFQKLLTVL